MSAEDHKTIIDGVQVIWTPNAIENLKELIESTEVQQLNFQEMKLLTERFAIASARRLRRHTVKILYETLFISPRYLTNCLTVDLAIPIQRIAERVKHVQTPATSHSRIIQGFQLFYGDSFHESTIDTVTGERKADQCHASITLEPGSLKVHIYVNDLRETHPIENLQVLGESVIVHNRGKRNEPDTRLSWGWFPPF